VDVQETSVYRRGLNGSTIDSIFYLKAKRPEFRDKLQLDIPAIHEEIKARITQLGIDPQTLQSASETRLLQKDTMATAGNNPDDHG